MPDLTTIHGHLLDPKLLPKVPIVLDFGATNADFAIEFYQKYGGIIYCFEPDPTSAAEAWRRVREARLEKRIFLFREAIADRAAAAARFYTFSGRKRVSSSLLYRGASQSIQVGLVTLVEVLKGFPRIDYLKMDIEGYEGLVLRACPKEEFRKIAQLSVELHVELHAMNTPSLVAEGLTSYGYEARIAYQRSRNRPELYARRR